MPCVIFTQGKKMSSQIGEKMPSKSRRNVLIAGAVATATFHPSLTPPTLRQTKVMAITSHLQERTS